MVSKEEVLKYTEDLKFLTGLSSNDLEILKKYKDIALQWTDDLVKSFYDILFSYEPTASIFREGEREERENTLKDWYRRLFEEINSDFWIWQWYVGIVHIKRKVYNRYMLGMLSRIQQMFLDKAVQNLPIEEALELYRAFKKATDVIAGVIAEGYHLTYVESLQTVAGVDKQFVGKIMKLHLDKAMKEFHK